MWWWLHFSEHLQKSCQEDWNIRDTQGQESHVTSSGELGPTSSSPMAISPTDLSTLNTPRSSLASVQSRTSPMNTENEQNLLTNQEPEVNELYLRYFDEEINFGGANGRSSRSQFEGNSYSTSMTFDSGPLAEFPSPPGWTLFYGPIDLLYNSTSIWVLLSCLE